MPKTKSKKIKCDSCEHLCNEKMITFDTDCHKCGYVDFPVCLMCFEEGNYLCDECRFTAEYTSESESSSSN